MLTAAPGGVSLQKRMEPAQSATITGTPNGEGEYINAYQMGRVIQRS